MSLIAGFFLSKFESFFLNLIKSRPVPKHIAIIMDGNRRYANKRKVEKSNGHVKGFNKLVEILYWCLELGVKELTAFAFSIENFKRSQDEVDFLMKLFEERLQRLLDGKDKIMNEGICVRVIGNLSLLSSKLRKLIAELTLLTKDNERIVLNIALAYTSRDEIGSTLNNVIEAVDRGAIEVDDIDENLISKCLYTNSSFDVDILIRTSGEVRLSDFLLWQVSKSNCQIYSLKVLWPEFSIWDLLACVLKYQINTDFSKVENGRSVENTRVKTFLDVFQQRLYERLASYL